MADREEIDEAPGSSGTTTVPPSGSGTDDDIDLMSLSCGDLGDLLTVVDNVILRLKADLDSTSKFRVIMRRSISMSLNAQIALRDGIKDAMDHKHCPG